MGGGQWKEGHDVCEVKVEHDDHLDLISELQVLLIIATLSLSDF